MQHCWIALTARDPVVPLAEALYLALAGRYGRTHAIRQERPTHSGLGSEADHWSSARQPLPHEVHHRARSGLARGEAWPTGTSG